MTISNLLAALFPEAAPKPGAPMGFDAALALAEADVGPPSPPGPPGATLLDGQQEADPIWPIATEPTLDLPPKSEGKEDEGQDASASSAPTPAPTISLLAWSPALVPDARTGPTEVAAPTVVAARPLEAMGQTASANAADTPPSPALALAPTPVADPHSRPGAAVSEAPTAPPPSRTVAQTSPDAMARQLGLDAPAAEALRPAYLRAEAAAADEVVPTLMPTPNAGAPRPQAAVETIDGNRRQGVAETPTAPAPVPLAGETQDQSKTVAATAAETQDPGVSPNRAGTSDRTGATESATPTAAKSTPEQVTPTKMSEPRLPDTPSLDSRPSDRAAPIEPGRRPAAKHAQAEATTEGPEPVDLAEGDDLTLKAKEAEPATPRQAPDTTLPDVRHVAARPDLESAEPAAETRRAVRQVSEHFEDLLAGRRPASLTVRLEPERLGSVEIRLSLVGNRLDADFSASNEALREALDHHRPHLAHAVESRGLSLQSLTVSADSGSSYSGQPFDRPQGQSGREAAPPSSPRFAPSSAPTDVRAADPTRYSPLSRAVDYTI